MFSEELERDAFLAANGEFGWTRAQIPMVVDTLRSRGMGILGGEVWWVPEGSTNWIGPIPQRRGPAGIYSWETRRNHGESWLHFVERAAGDALAAAERWPAPEDLPNNLSGQILYNLTWASEAESANLRTH